MIRWNTPPQTIPDRPCREYRDVFQSIPPITTYIHPLSSNTQTLNVLLRHELSGAFCEPIDLTLLPDYGDYVRKPLDLQTIW